MTSLRVTCWGRALPTPLAADLERGCGPRGRGSEGSPFWRNFDQMSLTLRETEDKRRQKDGGGGVWGSRGTPSQSQPASRPQLLEARPSGGRGAGGSGCGGLGRLHATVGGLRVGRWERPLPHTKASWGASPASHPNCRKPVGKTPQAEPVVSGTSTRQGSPAAALGRQRKRGGWWRSALRGLHPAASAHRGAGGGEAVPSLTRVRECACACVRGATPHSHCVLGKDKSAPVRKVPQAACGPLPCPALQPAPCISDPLSQHSTVRGLRAQTGGACPLPHP